MLNPEEKDILSFRVDYEKHYYDNSEANKNNNSPKGFSKGEKLLNPWDSYPHLWNEIFLTSCVIGVLIDPLFLYVPIIDEGNKCLKMDQNLKYIALILRTATDFSYIFHIFFRLRNALKMANELNVSIFTGFPWSHLVIDILAILPLPQMVVLKFFAKLSGSRSLMTRKIINLLLLLQYIPRLVRVYLSAKQQRRGFDSLASLAWVRGAFLFFLYIGFGHIFGALWYFYAIFRETACWHKACKKLTGCEPASPFDCRLKNPILNVTYLNDFCPVDPPNPQVYDFGIFSDAIESKILQQNDFLKKFSGSFWWGLKNLSSLGQNLDTSADVEQNFFAVLISILGLLLFLYLIGTLQTYMQLATTKSEEERKKIILKQPEIESFLSSHNLPEPIKRLSLHYFHHTIKQGKDFNPKDLFALVEQHSKYGQDNNKEATNALEKKIWEMKKNNRNTFEMKADLWVSKNGIDDDSKVKITEYARLRLIEGQDVDVTSLLNILPVEFGMSIKKFLCFPILKKVPKLENMDDCVYETICRYLKPVIYTENSYIIKKEEPLDFMLFVTQGVVWNYGSTNPMQCLQKGDFYGNELLEWRLNSTSYSEFPISNSNLKCHTKVEAFSLKAVDLARVLSHCWTKFSISNTGAMPEGLTHFATVSMQQKVRRNIIRNKNAKDQKSQLSIVTINN